MRSINFIRALGRAKVDNPQLNKVALDMFLKELMSPQKNEKQQRENAFREAIASKLLGSENPDYKKAYDVFMGGDLSNLWGNSGQGNDAWVARKQAAIQDLAGGSTEDVERANMLSQLTPEQYKQYEEYKAPGITGVLKAALRGDKDFNDTARNNLSWKSAANLGFGGIGLIKELTDPYRGYRKTKKQQFLEQLLAQ